jgi:PiT family inorganic phosphate transporter
MEIYTLAIIIIAIALIFDFLNGFHDAANAVATIVVTRTLTPLQAVLMAGFANFIGFLIFGVTIAVTIGKGIVHIEYITISIIFAGLIAAIAWNIATWILGLPTSSSHALIGGLVGSAVAAFGFKAMIFSGMLKIFLFIFIAPLLGMLGGIILTVLISWLFRKSNYSKSNKVFKKLQLASAFFYCLGHGTNDAQKTMGIIALVLFSAKIIPTFEVQTWVVLACHAAIAAGTIFGGWRIVKTMGTNITKIHAREGFTAETSSGIVLLGTAHFGIPVSTTHVISGSIMGVGSVESSKNVKWVTARKIVWAWILTIPITALVGALAYFLVHIFI